MPETWEIIYLFTINKLFVKDSNENVLWSFSSDGTIDYVDFSEGIL